MHPIAYQTAIDLGFPAEALPLPPELRPGGEADPDLTHASTPADLEDNDLDSEESWTRHAEYERARQRRVPPSHRPSHNMTTEELLNVAAAAILALPHSTRAPPSVCLGISAEAFDMLRALDGHTITQPPRDGLKARDLACFVTRGGVEFYAVDRRPDKENTR